jgi:hypothetical protein
MSNLIGPYPANFDENFRDARGAGLVLVHFRETDPLLKDLADNGGWLSRCRTVGPGHGA